MEQIILNKKEIIASAQKLIKYSKVKTLEDIENLDNSYEFSHIEDIEDFHDIREELDNLYKLTYQLVDFTYLEKGLNDIYLDEEVWKILEDVMLENYLENIDREKVFNLLYKIEGI